MEQGMGLARTACQNPGREAGQDRTVQDFDIRSVLRDKMGQEKDVLKQKRTVQNSRGCSKTGNRHSERGNMVIFSEIFYCN